MKHFVREAFLCYLGEAHWSLSSRAVLVISTYVLVITCIAFYAGALHASLLATCGDWWRIGAVGLHLSLCVIAGAATFGYAYVSSRAARSPQLHLHGLVMLAWLTLVPLVTVADSLVFQGACSAADASLALAYTTWGALKAALFMLIRQKMNALGHLTGCCVNGNRCVAASVVAVASMAVGGAALSSYRAFLVFNGATCEELVSSGGLTAKTSVADTVVTVLLLSMILAGSLGILAAGSGTMYVANSLRRTAVSKLLAREVCGLELATVQRTLYHHILGIVLSIMSTQMSILGGFLRELDFIGGEGRQPQEEFLYKCLGALDGVADIGGVLLLSGIGVLLFREDPGAGDISGHIRGVLHAAVLTSRAEIAFEGRVHAAVQSNLCVASFPGKFLADWHSLTWACEQDRLSSACVFLPTSDPQNRFGQHAFLPGAPGMCWCHKIYGEKKVWGCQWWQVWQQNIERAVELDLEIVAVFFPGEAGKGILKWDDLSTSNLWDGIGLGGSQKCEVAYMQMKGLRVTALDLEEFRHRVNNASSRAITASSSRTATPAALLGKPADQAPPLRTPPSAADRQPEKAPEKTLWRKLFRRR